MSEIMIGNRRIGDEHPPFVIAEVGINHEGELAKAKQMAQAAAAAGADCVKFQCHITEMEMIPSDITPGKITTERLWDLMKRCELTEKEEREVMAYCESLGIIYLCTPFSREASDRLEDMGVSAFKIGSGECNNLPLIEHVARKGKPMIVSTGMNDLESVRRTVNLIQKYDVPLLINHCTSLYPAPYENVRLGAIKQLKDAFQIPVGLSDHSMGIYTCLGGVALGACALEKHFTISRQWPGPDVPISIEPDELAEMVVGAKAIHEARGGSKTVLPEEQPVIDFAFASVVTIRDIAAGETVSLDNVWVKRPGVGPIPATELDNVLGKMVGQALATDIELRPEHLV